MSNLVNNSYQEWEIVQASLGRNRPCRGSVELSQRDRLTYFEVLKLNVLLLEDIAPTHSRRSQPNLIRWVRIHYNMDLLLFATTMKKVLQALFRWERSCTLSEFKQQIEVSSDIFGAIMAPVLDILDSFLQRGLGVDLAILNQFLAFSSRMSLLDLDLEQEMLQDYLDQEEKLKNFSYDSTILRSLNLIVREWFRDYQHDLSGVCHGPGSSASLGRVPEYQKWCHLYSDDRLEYLIHKSHRPESILFQPGKVDRLSEVRFVPKSIHTMRTICMEPVSLMFFQQACWNNQKKFISDHPYLSKIIKFSDQGQNNWMARVGSRTGYYSTLDLSAASDSVGWDLVKSIFRGTVLLREYWTTRSDRTLLTDGRIIHTAKFAPMGSAECFPTECIVFAAICELALREKGVRRREIYSIYGDDIIIWKDLSSRVIEILHACGFTTNLSKSFTSGFFRESCGGEYWKGDEITPVRIPRNYTGTLVHVMMPSLFDCCIEFCNNLYSAVVPLISVRRHVLRKFRNLPQRLRPLFDDGTLGIISPNPSNFDKITKTRKGLQTRGFLFGGLEGKSLDKREEDEIALHMWQFRADRRLESRVAFKEPEDTIVIKSDIPSVRLKTRYAPSPDLSEDVAYEKIDTLYKLQKEIG